MGIRRTKELVFRNTGIWIDEMRSLKYARVVPSRKVSERDHLAEYVLQNICKPEEYVTPSSRRPQWLLW